MLRVGRKTYLHSKTRPGCYSRGSHGSIFRDDTTVKGSRDSVGPRTFSALLGCAVGGRITTYASAEPKLPRCGLY